MTFSRELADRIVRDSFAHLLSLIGPKGRFVYAHKIDDTSAVSDGYNMLRHCGTLWFMLRAANERDLPLSATDTAALSRAVGYAGAKMARPDWLGGEPYALVTKGMIKTGGIGLSLMMLLAWQELARRHPTLDPQLPAPLDKTIAGLGAYGMQQTDGTDFIHKRALSDGTPTAFRSDYYTGEVLLGLICADMPKPLVGPLLRSLMASDYGIDIQSHWMAYAACEGIERAFVEAEFGEKYLHRLIADIATNTDYRQRRASTPIACRTEALTRILMLADRRTGTTTLSARTLDTARTEAVANLNLQLDWYRNGQFFKSDDDDKVQIDYIQHNATAYLNWLALS